MHARQNPVRAALSPLPLLLIMSIFGALTNSKISNSACAQSVPSIKVETLKIDEIKGWRSITGVSEEFKPQACSFSLSGGNKCSLVVIRPDHVKVRPVLSPDGKTAPTSKIVQIEKASFGVNGGYFNLTNGESTSYVVCAGKVVADPRSNKALTENPKLKPFLPQIFDRSEIRFLKAKDKLPLIQIAHHGQALPAGRVLEASLQGGPRLLPTVTASEEAFVRTEADGKVVDSIGVGRTAARTAVGMTVDGYLLVVTVAGKGQDEFSSGLTLADLAKLLKNLGAMEALNLDGGTSTTMIKANPLNSTAARAKDKETPYQMLIGRNPETRVRSALLIY